MKAELVLRNGFWWPKSDNWCHKVIHQELGDIDYALGFTDRREVAVQAGGNVGVWASKLAKFFGTVYTFEPDPVNFHCLEQNCPGDNIIKIKAALLDRPGDVGLVTDPGNVGAHYIGPGNYMRATALDELDLPACDYLCLDIEGSEPLALRGAEQTIRRHRPLIHIEEKGLSERYYGIPRSTCETWLAGLALGYRVVGKVRKDLIFQAR